MGNDQKWYNVVLEYLTNEKAYVVVMGMLKAFGAKISTALESAITKLGLAIGQLGIAIEELILVIEDEKKKKEEQEVKE